MAMEVRNAVWDRERWSANDVCGTAWKAALQNRPCRSPKVRKIAAPQGLRPRRMPSKKFVDQPRPAVRIVRWTGWEAHSQEWLCHGRAKARLAYPPTEEE